MFRALSSRLIPQRSSILLNQTFASGKSAESGTSNATCPPVIPEVPGLSDKVLKVPDCPVGFAGSKKNTDYKNPEYFCYHIDSFSDSMVELDKYRLPAPSAKKK